ncbi:MAG: hypothetical protein IH955_03415 [Chloroflexi bacterium]|nr:hypothetical protein [Chloroflexota bacterium]
MADVMTVTGLVLADQLGFTLAHEHLLCDYTPKWNGPEYLLNDQDLIYRELMRYNHAGGASIIDQTSGGMRCQTRDLRRGRHRDLWSVIGAGTEHRGQSYG